MNPLQTSDLIALGSLLIAAFALVGSFVGKTRDSSARDQLVNDKLDRNNEMARETRDTVRDMSRKLDDHSDRLVTVEQQVKTLFTSVGRIENNCDLHCIKPGGND